MRTLIMTVLTLPLPRMSFFMSLMIGCTPPPPAMTAQYLLSHFVMILIALVSVLVVVTFASSIAGISKGAASAAPISMIAYRHIISTGMYESRLRTGLHRRSGDVYFATDRRPCRQAQVSAASASSCTSYKKIQEGTRPRERSWAEVPRAHLRLRRTGSPLEAFIGL